MTTDYIDQFSQAWFAAFPAAAPRSNTVPRSNTMPDDEAWGPGVTEPELQLIGRVLRLGGLLEEVLRIHLRAYKLTHVEFDILTVLHTAGPEQRLTPSAISERILTTSGGTSTTLRRLEERGYISRETSPDDARSRWVYLTPAGARAVDDATRAVVPAQVALLRASATHDVELAAGALRNVLAGMGDTPDQVPPNVRH